MLKSAYDRRGLHAPRRDIQSSGHRRGGFTAVAVVGVALWQTDLLVARGFGKALEGAQTDPVVPARSQGAARSQAVAGDEGYWLTRAEVESPTPFAKPLALGDRITISGRDGRAHQLEIVDLKAVGTAIPVAAGSRHAQPRLLIVTCRTVGEAAVRARATVRFIVEADAVDPGTVAPAKTLCQEPAALDLAHESASADAARELVFARLEPRTHPAPYLAASSLQ